MDPREFRPRIDLRSWLLTGIRRDCVGGVMALGELGNNLAIVGAEFIKSCM
jgi:hypothetical protein